MKKKFVFALCMAAVMLLVPMSSIAMQSISSESLEKDDSVLFEKTVEDTSSFDASTVVVDETLCTAVKEARSKVSSVEESVELEELIDAVILEDGSFDVDAFTEVLEEEHYFEYCSMHGSDEFSMLGIPNELIMYFMSWLQDKLGWTYDSYLMIMNIYAKVLDVLALAELYEGYFAAMQDGFQEVRNLLDVLFPFHWWNIEMWTTLLELNWSVIVNAVLIAVDISSQWIGFLMGSGQYPDVLQVLIDVQNASTDFLTWYEEKHWLDDVLIFGTVKDASSGDGIEGVTVECRGNSSVTNVTGHFSFYVSSVPTDNDMIKHQAWLHNCQIFVNYDGDEQKSPRALSQAFSAGAMQWWFEYNSDDLVSEEVSGSSNSLSPVVTETTSVFAESSGLYLMK